MAVVEVTVVPEETEVVLLAEFEEVGADEDTAEEREDGGEMMFSKKREDFMRIALWTWKDFFEGPTWRMRSEWGRIEFMLYSIIPVTVSDCDCSDKEKEA